MHAALAWQCTVTLPGMIEVESSIVFTMNVKFLLSLLLVFWGEIKPGPHVFLLSQL